MDARILLAVGLCLLLTAALSVFPAPAHAITWNFGTDGESQGWVARMALSGGGVSTYLRPLRSEVTGGRWVVYPATYEKDKKPSIELISPRLEWDARLFDRVIVEARVLHPDPLAGRAVLQWATPSHSSAWAFSPDTAYVLTQQHIYSTDWEVIEFTGLGPRTVTRRGDQGSYEVVLGWDGPLTGVHVILDLLEAPPDQVGPGDVPAAIEIERIVLTGPEELLQGELAPPQGVGLAFGSYFGPPVFSPLADGVGLPEWGQKGRLADLGDLDEDGDLDLVAFWETSHHDHGWLQAYNDGTGFFSHPVLPVHAVLAGAYYLGLVDLDQDGVLELMVADYRDVRILSRGADGEWEVVRLVEGVLPVGTGDADADGYGDVFIADHAASRLLVILSRKGKPEEVYLDRDPFVEGAFPLWVARGVSPAGGDGVLWRPPWSEMLRDPGGDLSTGAGPFRRYHLTYLDRQMTVQESDVEVELRAVEVLHVRDVDRDGAVDIVVCDSGPFPAAYTRGVTCLHNLGDTFEAVPWVPAVRLRTGEMPQLVDLNGDDILDLVVCDTDIRGPSVVVSLGQPGTVELIPEGRYPIEGSGGQVLPGDVDNDGDIDLVVLEPARYDTGGVHVLLSRVGEQATVVAAEAAPTSPAVAVLGANHPNPFNPETTIPFSVPARLRCARLEIYNALGQRVRILMDGPVRSGERQVSWDGLDEEGQAAPSGVYVARLVSDTWSATRKMVKVE